MKVIANNINPARPNNSSGLFVSGARWLRADFHLHTEKDSQFEKIHDRNSYHKAWVDRLEENDIRFGVITNHNKFVLDEYKTLRKEAQKRGIFILPGVELCVQGGKSGVHILVVFDPETWVFNKENEDFINRFLDHGFPQIANRESEDTACEWPLIKALENLDNYRKNGRDSFVILAHVDDNKGAFMELGAGLRSHFNTLFEKSVLAVQKSRSQDNWNNLRQWVKKDWVPARVEGSDCKSLDTVGCAHTEGGHEKHCYLKLGAFSFQAVRLALLMKEQRVSEKLPKHQAGHIRSVTFTGGLLDGQTLFFNPDMNNFIGIRGSGKSSLIECLRYLLSIDLTRFDENAEDADYKEKLVKRTLESGGKISAELVSGDNETYRLERILGETPRVSKNGETIPNLRPQSMVKALYFGQKDLAKFSEKNFARDLLNRFTEEKGLKEEEEIEQVRHRIEQRLVIITQSFKHLERIDEVKADLAAVKESLKKFEKEELQKKLNAQIALENDVKEGTEIVSFQAETIASLRRCYEEYSMTLKRRLSRKSSSGNKAFKEVMYGLNSFDEGLEKLNQIIEELEKAYNDTQKAQTELNDYFDSKKEEFARIRRTLKIEGDLNPDTYVELTKKQKILKTKLSELENISKKKNKAQEDLLKDLILLQSLWHEEFQKRLQQVEKLNNYTAEVTIKLKFKDDKNAFVNHLNDLTSGIHKRTLQKVCEVFADGVELYRDLFGGANRLTKEAELNQLQIIRLRDSLEQNLKSVISYRPPDQVEIFYKSKPLHEHSLGQRATALMLFLLSKRDFDILIIDQPEDDLDNQTIYTEVIKRLLDLKGYRQIIFATHSPNIPVLGDAEQIFRCEFSPDTIGLIPGSIDDSQMQLEVVTVMEGGVDAFKKRQQIYEAWKH
ncbi:MAG: AAA family ATPase [Verrucomicrobia bacterium]|nr:AAA family ATPase [Verrucomicrobiota bacterium]